MVWVVLLAAAQAGDVACSDGQNVGTSNVVGQSETHVLLRDEISYPDKMGIGLRLWSHANACEKRWHITDDANDTTTRTANWAAAEKDLKGLGVELFAKSALLEPTAAPELEMCVLHKATWTVGEHRLCLSTELQDPGDNARWVTSLASCPEGGQPTPIAEVASHSKWSNANATACVQGIWQSPVDDHRLWVVSGFIGSVHNRVVTVDLPR